MKRATHFAVIGLGFGDEGKGHIVDWLCARHPNALVVRFSGGPQAAHQVVMADGSSHVFSHFGSGSFRGCPTYWSKYCPADPFALNEEWKILRDKGVKPTIYISPESPLITPYEVMWNRAFQSDRFEATCGVGIYATKRREDAGHHITFSDIYHPQALEQKLDAIAGDHYSHLERKAVTEEMMEKFWEACERVKYSDYINLALNPPGHISDLLVFEGSQGLLLDQNYGFFPFVTPSNTGLQNIVEMGFDPYVYLVTRAYQTRHGKGPMSDMFDHAIKTSMHEKNDASGLQGEFRRTLLDLDMLKYAVSKVPELRKGYKPALCINCMDHVEGDHRLQKSGEIVYCGGDDNMLRHIRRAAGADVTYVSYGPTAEQIKEHQFKE